MTRLATSTNTIVDPVCGMNVQPGNAAEVFTFEGDSYYFCAEGCRKAFEKNPSKFLKPAKKKRKGLWGRYLDRLNRATEREPIKCH